MKSLDLAIILKLVDKVTAPLKGVAGSFTKVKGHADQAIASISRFERIASAVQRTSDRLKGLVSMAGKASAALATVGGVGMGALASNATNVTADFESMGVVLDTLYHGDKQQIGKAKNFLKDFMAESPFETASITEGFNRLKSYGIDPMGSLRTLGDTAAAMGKDIMSAVEMMSDAIMGENERLKEFGIKGSAIQGTDYIQYEYTDKNGIQQKLQVLKNDRKQIQRVLTQILNDNYGGAQAKLAKTWKGLTSNTKDALNNLQMQFMNAGLFDFMKDGLQDKLNMITELSKSGKIEQWGKRASDYMRLASQSSTQLKADVMDAARKLSEFVGGWENLGKIGAGATGLWLFRDVIFAVGAGIGLLPLLLAGVTASLVDWRKLLPDIQSKVKAVFQQFQNWGGFPKLKAEGLPLIQAQVANLKAHFNRLLPLFEQGAEKALAFGRRVATALAGLDFAKALPVLTFAFSISPFRLMTQAAKELWAVFEVAFSRIRGRLPVLRQQFGDVFGVIRRYLSDNAGTVRATVSGVLVVTFEKLAQSLAWLSAKARDGSLRGWLDAAAQKIPVVLDNVLAFGQVIWATMLKVGTFTSKFVEFIGGWDKLAMVFAGGWLIAQLSGFLQGLGALLGIITFLASPVGLLVALIVGLAIAARYVYLEWDNMSTQSKALAVGLFAVIGAIAVAVAAYKAYTTYLKIAAWWTAFQLTPLGAWIAGLTWASVASGVATAATAAFGAVMAVITSPITLVIGLIALLAAGAYYLYQNWDTIKPMLLAFWDDIIAAWETFKTWVAGLIDGVTQAFWDGWEKVKAYTLELTTKILRFFADLPAKMLNVGSNIINGLWDGLKGSADAVVSWMSDFGSDIINSAKDILDINSPSRVFADIGRFTVEGMQQGMALAQPKLFSFLEGFGNKLKVWWSGVTDAFKGDDLAHNIGEAIDATKKALPTLPSLPAPVSAALDTAASMLPGVSTFKTVSNAVAQVGKQPTVAGLIHWGESRQRGYNDYNRGSDKWSASNKQNIDLAQMSVGQIMAAQALPRGSTNRLFAVGKYQVVPDTMKEAVAGLGVSLSEKFTPALQEKIFAEYLAARKRPQIEKYIKGGGNIESASHAVAQEWASVASVKTGRGVYDKVGVNHASIKAPEMLAALNTAKAEYARLIAQGKDEKTAYALALGATATANTTNVPNTVLPTPASPLLIPPVKNLSQDTGEGVHPHLMALYQRASELAKQQGETIIIKDGLRTIEEQAKYVREGHSKTMNSRHIPAANGVGHALDLTMPYAGQQSNKQDWVQVRKINAYMQQASKELNIPIEWGGNWKSFKDGFHWQLPWKQYAANQAISNLTNTNTSAVANHQSAPQLPVTLAGGVDVATQNLANSSNLTNSISQMQSAALQNTAVNQAISNLTNTNTSAVANHQATPQLPVTLAGGVDVATKNLANSSNLTNSISQMQSAALQNTAVNQAISNLQNMAANDPNFSQVLVNNSGIAAKPNDKTVVPFTRPATPVLAPHQTITITINAASGMNEQDIAAEVKRVLKAEHRKAEANYRGRAYD